HGDARRSAAGGTLDDGGQWTGDVPRADSHQHPRLWDGSAGGRRAAALRDRRRRRALAAPGDRGDGHRAPRRPSAEARVHGPRTEGASREAGAAALHTNGPGARAHLPRRHDVRRRRSARRRRGPGLLMCRLALVLGLLLLLASVAHAAEWQTIQPGESTQEAVRAQFGQPTKVSSQKVEGYDSAQWLYDGPQAPRGVARMTIDFGLLTPQGYKPEIVRVIQLQPKPGVFT